MPRTINELRVQVQTNNFGKMQYFHVFDGTDIVLDQCPNKNQKINTSLPYYS